MARMLVTIDLELHPPNPMVPGAEAFLRIHADDAPLVAVPLTVDGRRVALDSVRRLFELTLRRLEEEAGCGT